MCCYDRSIRNTKVSKQQYVYIIYVCNKNMDLVEWYTGKPSMEYYY